VKAALVIAAALAAFVWFAASEPSWRVETSARPVVVRDGGCAE